MPNDKINQCYFSGLCMFTIIFIIFIHNEKYTYSNVYVPGVAILSLIYIIKRYMYINPVQDDIIQIGLDNIDNDYIDNMIDGNIGRNMFLANQYTISRPFIFNNDNINNYNEICCICLENINIDDLIVNINSCEKHIYHFNCGDKYIKSDFIVCPLCNV